MEQIKNFGADCPENKSGLLSAYEYFWKFHCRDDDTPLQLKSLNVFI